MCQVTEEDIRFAVKLNRVMNSGKPKKFFIIICDSFSYEHHALYFNTIEEAQDHKETQDMQRVLPGIYNADGTPVLPPVKNAFHNW